MADQASSSITIDAAPDAVLAVIRDVEAYPEWTDGIAKAEVLEEGPSGPKRVAFSMSQSGMSDEYTLAYEWQDDGVTWLLAEPSNLQKSQKGSYRLVAEGDHTQVIYHLTMDIKIPMIGLMKRKAEKMIIERALKALKKRVESLP